MRTRLTELLGIEHPLVQGGMVWSSGAKLAAAVSQAGGLGLIGAGSMGPELLEAHIRKARELTQKPFGVNLPLLYRHAEDNLQVILDQEVPVVFTSAGSPKKTTPLLKEAGRVVFHVVSSPSLAEKCEAVGVDGVVAEGFEAGGHNGREELTTMVLIPGVKAAVNVPVVAAGGIATGAQMAAALALGADGVQVGTRFAATQEASGHEGFKRRLVDASPTDTHLVLKKGIPVRLLQNEFRKKIQEAEARGASREELVEMLGFGRERRGMFDGELEAGELEAGQVVGLIDSLLPAAEVVDALVRDCRSVLSGLSRLNQSSGPA